MFIEIWTVKGHSDEIWNKKNEGMSLEMSLESAGKAILVINWQRTWLNRIHVLEFCGR